MDIGKSAGQMMKNAFSAMTGLSGGDVTQKALEALGMPQQGAAFMGALHDMKAGNLVGMAQNFQEALTGFESGKGMQNAMQALAGGGCCSAHHVGSPSVALTTNFERVDLKNMQGKGGGAMATLGGMAAGFALGGPFGGLVGGALGNLIGKTGKRSKAKCLEKRLNRDPSFRAKFEQSVGGKYIPDGRNDGKITIARTGFKLNLPGLNPGAFGALGGNQIGGSVMSGMMKMMGNIAGLVGQMGMGGNVSMGGQMIGQGTFGFDKTASGANAEAHLRGQAKPGSMMSKLPQPCHFEDLVAAFMFDTVKEAQDEIKKLMTEYDKGKTTNNGKQGEGADAAGGAQGAGGAEGGGRAGRSRGGYAGGMLGGLGNIVGKVGGGLLGGIAGPLGSMIGSGLGGALGGMLGKGVGGIVDGIGGMLGGGGGGGIGGLLGGGGGGGIGGLLGGGGQAQGAGGAQGAQGAEGQQGGLLGGIQGAEKNSESRQEMFERLKMLMQKLQEMQQSLSNILNVMHDGAMGTIRNIRG